MQCFTCLTYFNTAEITSYDILSEDSSKYPKLSHLLLDKETYLSKETTINVIYNSFNPLLIVCTEYQHNDYFAIYICNMSL